MTSVFPEVGAAIKQGMRNVTVLTQAPTERTGTMVALLHRYRTVFCVRILPKSRLGYDKRMYRSPKMDGKSSGRTASGLFRDGDGHDRGRSHPRPAGKDGWTAPFPNGELSADFTVEETKNCMNMHSNSAQG